MYKIDHKELELYIAILKTYARLVRMETRLGHIEGFKLIVLTDRTLFNSLMKRMGLFESTWDWYHDFFHSLSFIDDCFDGAIECFLSIIIGTFEWEYANPIFNEEKQFVGPFDLTPSNIIECYEEYAKLRKSLGLAPEETVTLGKVMKWE